MSNLPGATARTSLEPLSQLPLPRVQLFTSSVAIRLLHALQDQLHSALTAIEEWKAALREGGGLDVRAVTDPTTAAAELRRVRTFAEKQQQQQPSEDVSTLRQREAALQMQLAERNLENIELRRHAHVARQCSDPSIAQVLHAPPSCYSLVSARQNRANHVGLQQHLAMPHQLQGNDQCRILHVFWPLHLVSIV